MSEVLPKPFSPDPKLLRLLTHGCAKADGLGLPPHYGPAESWNPAWADRLALTAAWLIEHSGLNRPAKVQSAIVFRETRTTETAWKVCPDGDHLTIQVVHGPRAHTSVRWRISDGMEVTNYGVPLRNQSLSLPNLSFQVEMNTTPEAALLEALRGAGFFDVATEKNAPA